MSHTNNFNAQLNHGFLVIILVFVAALTSVSISLYTYWVHQLQPHYQKFAAKIFWSVGIPFLNSREASFDCFHHLKLFHWIYSAVVLRISKQLSIISLVQNLTKFHAFAHREGKLQTFPRFSFPLLWQMLCLPIFKVDTNTMVILGLDVIQTITKLQGKW